METITIRDLNEQLIDIAVGRRGWAQENPEGRGRKWEAGVQLYVRVHSDLEEYFRTVSGGIQEDARQYGRHWRPSGGLSTIPSVWHVPAPLQGPFDQARQYTIWAPGGPIFQALDMDGDELPPRRQDPNTEVINISFLRLVGASEGVRFNCEALVSSGQIEGLAKKLDTACRAFCIDYLQPISYRIHVNVAAESGLYQGLPKGLRQL